MPEDGMSKKKKKSPSSQPQHEERNYYHLNTRAVDELVTANEENSPPVSAKELRKYQSGPRIKMADWVKAILLKCWAGGMVCYFFIWGLSTLTMNQWDQLLILGIVLGLVTNLIVNNIFRFIAAGPGLYDRWMMFPGKSIAFLPLDILYALLLMYCTMQTYNGINVFFAGGGESAGPVLAVEPILFGVFLTLWDLLFLGVKRLWKRMLAEARAKAGKKE